MKRASLVLAFASLAALDVLVVVAKLSIDAPPAPLPASLPVPPTRAPARAELVEAAGEARRPPRRSRRTDLAEQRYRPALDARYATSFPPRAVAGWVFEQLDEQWYPVEGATIRIWSGRKLQIRDEFEEDAPLGMTETGEDGAFLFPDIEPGEYTACVDSRNRTSRVLFGRVAEDGARQPGWKIVFGNSSLRGKVFDVAGEPMAGVTFVLCPQHSEGWCLNALGGTNVLGDFEVTGLPADQYTLYIGSGREGALCWPHQRIDFALEERETHRIEAGTRTPSVEWSGSLRDRQGAPLRASGCRLEFECPGLAGDGTQRITVEARLREDGSFRVTLPAGRWRPRLVGTGATPAELAEVSLGGDACSADLVVP